MRVRRSCFTKIGELVPAAVTAEAAPPGGADGESAGPLAATELILLHGEKFADKEGFFGGHNYELMHSEESPAGLTYAKQ